MAKQGKKHDRAQGETQITISLPVWLRDELNNLSQADDRSRSKWIVRELTKLIQGKRQSDIHQLEQPARYQDDPIQLAKAAEDPEAMVVEKPAGARGAKAGSYRTRKKNPKGSTVQ